MLDVTKLTRRYGDFKAVDNVSFTIKTGEIVGLLGHNGAGKTTIMKMISGYLEPSNGSVSLDGVSLEDDAKLVQQGLGYLPESLPVYPEMSVADYLNYAAGLKGLEGEIKNAEIKRVIQATDISEKLLAPIATLSRGYKQRVGVAQAILGKPKLLILDEPTNGLDPEQTLLMRKLIKDIAQDATVILSTHIMQEVEAICSRVLMLRAGQLAVDELLENLKRSNSLLLHTSLPSEQSTLLTQLAGIASVSALPSESGTAIYRIEIEKDAELDNVAALVAETIVQAKHKLIQLKPEIRDLESLFKEVNQTSSLGGISHAA